MYLFYCLYIVSSNLLNQTYDRYMEFLIKKNSLSYAVFLEIFLLSFDFNILTPTCFLNEEFPKKCVYVFI